MAMRVEGNGGQAPAKSHRLIHVPGIKSGISDQIGREKAQMGNQLDVERHEVGDIVLVEGLSVQSQDDIAIVGEVGSSQAQAIAPQILFDFFGGAIGLFLVAALFNAASDNRDHLWVVDQDCSVL